MAEVMRWLIPLAMAAVAVVLALGLFNMVRAGHPARRSQRLMRWRVILQFTAVAAMMIGLYFATT